MKKVCIKVLSILFVLVLALSCFSIVAAAASQTTELFTLDSVKNMGISVTYDKEVPTVEFIAPNGEVYGAAAISAGKMTKTDSGKALFFRIPNAQAGSWKITYDKKSNTNVEVNYAPYATGLTVKDFSFTKTNDNTLNVKFSASHDKKLSYSYVIYAVVTENDTPTGQRELNRGSANANEQKSLDINIGNLSTYQNYKLMIEVTAKDNGLEVFDSMVSTQTFAYTDPNAEAAPDNFYLETDMTNESVLVNWENTIARGRETLVSVYINDASEPSYYNSFASDVTATRIPFDASTTTKIKVELLYRSHNGKNSAVSSRAIEMSVAKSVTLVCDDVTSSAQAQIVYKMSNLSGGPFKAFLTVNDREAQEILLKGDNSFSLNLESFNNKVDLIWYYDEFTAFRVGKEIYSDRLAPTLRIPDVSGVVKTDKSTYVLTGTVDIGCTVTVNGTQVEIDANGIFTTELKLNVGENVFEVMAIGPNGNSTKESVVVEWVEPGVIASSGKFGFLLQYIPLGASMIFALIVLLFALKQRKNYRTLKSEKDLRTARFAVLKDLCVLMVVFAALVTVFCAVMMVLSIIKVSSAEFAEVALKSITEAYELIKTRNAYIIATVVSAVLVALFVALRILLGKYEKKAPTPKDPKPKKEKTEKKADLPKVQIRPNAVQPPKPQQQKPQQPKPQAPKAAQTPPETECFCGYCGTKNDNKTNFCKKCGKPLKK